MKTTRYFEEQVLRKRPYIERDWCARAVADPIRREDGETVHNAFFDRNFREEPV